MIFETARCICNNLASWEFVWRDEFSNPEPLASALAPRDESRKGMSRSDGSPEPTAHQLRSAVGSPPPCPSHPILPRRVSGDDAVFSMLLGLALTGGSRALGVRKRAPNCSLSAVRGRRLDYRTAEWGCGTIRAGGCPRASGVASVGPCSRCAADRRLWRWEERRP